MISLLLLSILILVFWLRIARPSSFAIQGRVIHDARVPLLARLRMHAAATVVVLVTALAMSIFWDLPWWGGGVAIVAMAGLVALPIRYTLTVVGIRCGWTPFRRWTEFGGVSRSPGGVRLQGVAGARDMRVWLSGSRGDDEFVLLLQRMITGGYKGKNMLIEYPPTQTSSEPPASIAATTDTSRTVL